MANNPLLLRGMESGWIQKFFNQPFDPINIMLAMRAKMMLDVIDELGHSYNLLRSIGFGWVDWGDIPGETPGVPDTYIPPALQAPIPIIPGGGAGAGVGATGGTQTGTPMPGQPGYIPPNLTDKQLAQLQATESTAQTLDQAELAQSNAELESLQNISAEIVTAGSCGSLDCMRFRQDLGVTITQYGIVLPTTAIEPIPTDGTPPEEFKPGPYIPGSQNTNMPGTFSGTPGAPGAPAPGPAAGAPLMGGGGSTSMQDSMSAPWGFGDQGLSTGKPGYAGGGEGGGWNCCLNEDLSGDFVHIGYTSLNMNPGDTQELTVVGARADCAEFLYEWAVGAIGGSVSPISGLSTIFTAPTGSQDCDPAQIINLYCDSVIVDTITITIASCPAEASIGYTSLGMAVNTSQTLTAVPVVQPCGAGPYTWAITAGTGSLNTAEGESVIYTAPATNANCVNNPTITLSCDGVLLDSIQLAINATGPYVKAYHILNKCNYTCDNGATLQCGNSYCGYLMPDPCSGYYFVCSTENFYCNDSHYSYTGTLSGSNPNPATCGGFYNTYCTGPQTRIDDRSAGVKLAGCCPAGML